MVYYNHLVSNIDSINEGLEMKIIPPQLEVQTLKCEINEECIVQIPQYLVQPENI